MLWKIFGAALAVRWVYALALFATMGEAGLQTLDSNTYLGDAHTLAQAIDAGALHGLQWLGPSTATMPLFGWLIGLHALLFGQMTAYAYVLTQGILDAGTCVIIYHIAQALNPKMAFASAISAMLNPTQIVLTGLVYTDTLFLFFVALFLLAAARWLHAPTWRSAALCGVGLGAATMTRILAAPWAAFLMPFLLIAALIQGRDIRRVAAQLVLTSAIAGLFIAPVLWRNVSQYGAWSFTSQSGIHLANFIVPLVMESHDGTPWQVGYEQMQAEVRSRFPAASNNPFQQSQHFEVVAREKLAELGVAPITKAWIFGAVINLAAPAVTLSPLVAGLPHSGFYATPGTSPAAKAFNFLFHSGNAIYAWVLLVGIAGLAVIRLIQIIGLFALIRQGNNLPALALFIFWILYVLAASGPVASPKYRLPIEPILMVLAGAGICRIGFLSNTPTRSCSRKTPI